MKIVLEWGEIPEPTMPLLSRRALRDMHSANQGGRCAYCDEPMTDTGPMATTLDRITPGAAGGEYTETNTVAACLQCNRLKGCMTVSQIRRLADRVEALGCSFAAGDPS